VAELDDEADVISLARGQSASKLIVEKGPVRTYRNNMINGTQTGLLEAAAGK